MVTTKNCIDPGIIPMTEADDRAAAYHEAGHCVMSEFEAKSSFHGPHGRGRLALSR